MKKLLILADGLHLQDGVHLKLGKILSLAVFLMVLFASSGQQAKSEVPNGDGDLLWERGLSGRSVNDAVFHPINGGLPKMYESSDLGTILSQSICKALSLIILADF